MNRGWSVWNQSLATTHHVPGPLEGRDSTARQKPRFVPLNPGPPASCRRVAWRRHAGETPALPGGSWVGRRVAVAASLMARALIGVPPGASVAGRGPDRPSRRGAGAGGGWPWPPGAGVPERDGGSAESSGGVARTLRAGLEFTWVYGETFSKVLTYGSVNLENILAYAGS